MMVRPLDEGSIAPGTDGQVLTTVLGRAAWAAPPSGGGGGGSGRNPQWNPRPGETSIDEFNDDLLDVEWARVDKAGGAARATWAEGGDVLSVYNDSGDASAELHAMVRPIATPLDVGDGFVTHVTLDRANDFVIAGIALADGAVFGTGSQVVGMFEENRVSSTRLFVNWSSNTSAVAGPASADSVTYLRLACVAANTWRCDTSPDDVSWRLGSTRTLALAPTHVGLFSSSWGSSTKAIASYEFVRRVSGIV